MPVLVCGNVVFDILARPVDRIQYGATIAIDEVSQQLGGNAGTTSYTIAKLGVPVSLATLAGRDAAGESVLGQLGKAGVDLSLVQYVNAPTSIAISLIDSKADRALLYLLGAASEQFADFEIPKSTTHFHLAAVYRMRHLRTEAPRFLKQARDAGLRTSLDAQWDTEGEWMKVLAPSLPFTDYTLLNEDEAFHLTGHSDPENAARALRDRGARHVVIKLGPSGCWADGVYIAGHAVEAIDTTGAGDCFSGGFIAALERGLSMADAARVANVVGGLSVRKVGATAGVLDWNATEAWLSSITG